MSRRRANYTTTPSVTADALVDMVYGAPRARHEHIVVPGCQGACCAPWSVDEAEAALWTGIWIALGLEAVAVVVGLCVWRWV